MREIEQELKVMDKSFIKIMVLIRTKKKGEDITLFIKQLIKMNCALVLSSKDPQGFLKELYFDIRKICEDYIQDERN